MTTNPDTLIPMALAVMMGVAIVALAVEWGRDRAERRLARQRPPRGSTADWAREEGPPPPVVTAERHAYVLRLLDDYRAKAAGLAGALDHVSWERDRLLEEREWMAEANNQLAERVEEANAELQTLEALNFRALPELTTGDDFCQRRNRERFGAETLAELFEELGLEDELVAA